MGRGGGGGGIGFKQGEWPDCTTQIPGLVSPLEPIFILVLCIFDLFPTSPARRAMTLINNIHIYQFFPVVWASGFLLLSTLN